MAAYARLTIDALAVERIEDYDPARYADRALNPEYARLVRPLVIDAQPAVTAVQVVVFAGYVIELAQVRRTWSVRAKTAADLELDSLRDEHAQLVAIVADLQAQRAVDRATWDGYTAAQLRAEQWRDRQVLLRFAHFAARRIKAGL